MAYFLPRDLDSKIAPRSVKSVKSTKSDESSNDKLTPKEKRQRKVRKVMREFKNGELMIGRSDKPVKSRKQAIAIALNSKLDSDEYSMGYIASESEEIEPMTVRPSCSECLEKHLGAAMVLLAEAETDYPEHRLLAIGHLHEAEEESRAAWPGISLAIRQMRKRLQQDNITPDFYQMARMLQLMDGDGDEDVMVMLDRLDSAGQDIKKTPAKPSEKITGSGYIYVHFDSAGAVRIDRNPFRDRGSKTSSATTVKASRVDSFITFDEAKAGFERMRDEVYSKYKSTVNMSASELEKWAETDASKQASLSNAPIKRNLRLLSKPKTEWDTKDVRDANRTISFVARMRGASQGKKNTETGYSDRDVSLKNWAFDPAK